MKHYVFTVHDLTPFDLDVMTAYRGYPIPKTGASDGLTERWKRYRKTAHAVDVANRVVGDALQRLCGPGTGIR